MYTNCNACGFPAEGPPADDRQCPECGREAQDPWPVVSACSGLEAECELLIGPWEPRSVYVDRRNEAAVDAYDPAALCVDPYGCDYETQWHLNHDAQYDQQWYDHLDAQVGADRTEATPF